MAADVIVEGDYYAQVPEWLLSADFSSNAVKLYAILRRYADKSTKMAHPSRKTLADRMGFTRPASVDAAIKELSDKGALEIFPRYRLDEDGKPTPERTSNGYRLFTTRKTEAPTEVVAENVLPTTTERTGVVPETVQGVVGHSVGGVVRQTVQQNHSHLEPQSVEPQSLSRDVQARPEVTHLCTVLADLIEANGSKRPNITKRWEQEARLLLDRDGYTPQQVEWMIRWTQKDNFWKTNILSMPKLREKFDQLKLKAQTSTPRTTTERMNSTVELGRRLQERAAS